MRQVKTYLWLGWTERVNYFECVNVVHVVTLHRRHDYSTKHCIETNSFSLAKWKIENLLWIWIVLVVLILAWQASMFQLRHYRLQVAFLIAKFRFYWYWRCGRTFLPFFRLCRAPLCGGVGGAVVVTMKGQLYRGWRGKIERAKCDAFAETAFARFYSFIYFNKKTSTRTFINQIPLDLANRAKCNAIWRFVADLTCDNDAFEAEQVHITLISLLGVIQNPTLQVKKNIKLKKQDCLWRLWRNCLFFW